MVFILTLVCGIPNAGKTTFSKQYGNALHQDDIGTEDRVLDAVRQIDGDAVIEGYFGTKDIRRKILNAYDGNAKCIFLDISVDESIQRENRGRHEIILRNAFRRFEPPTLDEGWDEIIIIRGEHEQHCYR